MGVKRGTAFDSAGVEAHRTIGRFAPRCVHSPRVSGAEALSTRGLLGPDDDHHDGDGVPCHAAACPELPGQAARVLRSAPQGAVRARLTETDHAAAVVGSHVSLLGGVSSVTRKARRKSGAPDT